MPAPLQAAMEMQEIWRACDEAVETAFASCYAWAVNVYPFEKFCVAAVYDGEDEVSYYKIPFEVSAGEAGKQNVVLLVDQKAAIEKKWLYKGTNEIAASKLAKALASSKIPHLQQMVAGLQEKRTAQFTAKIVATGADAAAMLDELKSKNPLFAALDDTPNHHPVIFDLTTVGAPSHHAGKWQFQLAQAGMAKAMPTIISKPIHVTADMEGHIDGDPKPIGCVLGLVPMEAAADGSVVLRAVGTLWDQDFPEEVEAIASNKDVLGASYELVYNVLSASAISASVIELRDYIFGGCAILKQSAAAHPETRVHVAARQLARITPSKEAIMAGRYAGFSTEQAPQIDAIVAAALADFKESMEAKGELAAAQSKATEIEQKLASKITELEAAIARAEAAEAALVTANTDLTAEKAKVAALTTELEAAKVTLATAEAARVKAENEAKVEDLVKEVAAAKGLQPDAAIFTDLRPILAKQVAGEALTKEELGKLMAVSGPKDKVVPLFAGNGAPPAASTDATLVKKNFPALGAAGPRYR